MKSICGIDVSSQWIDVSLDGKPSKRFARSEAGFKKLVVYAKGSDLFVMEATGAYHESVARFLIGQGKSVAVVNPARAAHYARAIGMASKTDATDARMLAQYAQRNPVPAFVPKTTHQQEVTALVRARANLIEERARLRNQLKAPELHASVRALLEERVALCKAQIKTLDAQIELVIARDPQLDRTSKLLATIPSLGKVCRFALCAELNIDQFNDAKALSAFFGTNPRQHNSGSSVRRLSRMSKRGNAWVRMFLYMSALTALRYEPFKSFYLRLVEKGKPKRAALGAVMNKLVRVVFGVLKSGRPFRNEGLTTT